MHDFNVVSVHGVPRSGTSWLGQIFNSHPDVAYRFQPLFAYRFKDRIKNNSTKSEIEYFLRKLYALKDDDFILNGLHKPNYQFVKSDPATHLVMKMVRYHYLIDMFIREIAGIKLVGIVRNPCAVVNSWLQAPKEFNQEWEPIEEWRYALKKNAGRIEEFNGYEKWKELTLMFLAFEGRFPNQFRLVQYEHLVNDPVSSVEKLFDFVELSFDKQVKAFLFSSHNEHDPHPYAVMKNPHVKDRWRVELDTRIAREIEKDVEKVNLQRFML